MWLLTQLLSTWSSCGSPITSSRRWGDWLATMSKTAKAPILPWTSLYLTGTKAFDRSHSSLDAVVGSNKNVANPSALLLNGWAMLTWFLRTKGNSMATCKRPEHRLLVCKCSGDHRETHGGLKKNKESKAFRKKLTHRPLALRCQTQYIQAHDLEDCGILTI